jgi:hypothetical protein
MTEAAETSPLTPAEISGLSAEESKAVLEKMSTDFRGKPAEDPQSQLSRKYANHEWRSKLEARDPATLREFDKLTAAAAVVDPVDIALGNSPVPDVPPSEMRQKSELANYLKSVGITDVTVLKEAISTDSVVTQATRDKVLAWKTQATTNLEWTKAYLSGSVEHVRQMALANSVLIQPVKGKAQ